MKKLQVTAAYDESLIKEYDYDTEERALAAISDAYEVYSDRKSWLSGAQRIEILNRLAISIESKVEELALQAAREGGKPLRDSVVELRRAVNGVRVASAAIPHLVALYRSHRPEFPQSRCECRGIVR